MPGFDRTGPEGRGSKTGRMQGRCNPDNSTDLNDYPRRGRGWRFGLKNFSKSDDIKRLPRQRRRW